MKPNVFSSFFNFFNTIKPIIQAIKQAGGIPYLVGGCVRDLVIGRELKDFDIEVHKLSLEQLETILKKFGPVMLVGKKFGVLRIAGLDADWSLPRKDSKGRKPTVAIDPAMSIGEACRRRDVTMNAMALDLGYVVEHESELEKNVTTHIIDPYGGLDDIHNKRLRAVDQTLFLEDPLRFFRVMQFIGRFEMIPDQALNNLCASMDLKDATTNAPLARERIYEEIKKLLLKSRRPSLGFRWLVDIKRLQELFPELYTLIGVTQATEYHPEGDVFEHTMQTLDATAQLPYYVDQPTMPAAEEKYIITLAALCHDLGKPATTDQNLHAHGHEQAGVTPAKKLLKRLTNDQSVIKAVLKLVAHHMLPANFLEQQAGAKAYKRMALKLVPDVTLRQLALVALADKQGRNPHGQEPLIEQHHEMYKKFLQHAEEAMVAHGPEAPLLLGRHLLDVVSPGPAMGKMLKEAYRIQIEEGIRDIEVLKQKAQEYSDGMAKGKK